MKITISAIIFLACVATGLDAQSTTQSQVIVPAPTPYTIVNQDANSRVWQRQVQEVGPDGQIVTNIHSYTEISSGLNFKDANGNFQPSKAEIVIQPDGTGAAIQAQHKAFFPIDISNGRITLVTPEGLQVSSEPLELSYFDGTNTVVLAELTNSIGVLVGDNQVVYPNAFVGLKADIRYTITLAGLEQDVILKQQPFTPEFYNLFPATCRLQMVSRFFNSPNPTAATTTLPQQAGISLVDQSIGFGSMQMVLGHAFLLGQSAAEPGALVAKSWLVINGMQFLVEEIPVNAIVDGLAALPLTAMNTGSSKASYLASRRVVLPQHRTERKTTGKIMLAKGRLPATGFVLDYQTINGSLTNMTFRGDSTYFISGATYLYGASAFEGGTIIKYTNNASLNFPSANPVINWSGTAYRPVVFTAKDDDSVGDSIAGSTGSPTNYYGNPALNFNSINSPTVLSNLRISWASVAVNVYASDLYFYNSQFVNCLNGFEGSYGGFYLRNTLFANVLTNLSVYDIFVDIQNSTFAGSSCVASGITSTGLYITNCVFANIGAFVTNSSSFFANADFNGFYNCATFGSDVKTSYTSPFQTAGAGNYYLTSGCAFHAAGTTNIDPTLLSYLSSKTTYPPLILSNSITSSPTTLVPQAQRDDYGFPDLGYSYDPIDYIVDNYWVTNTTLTLANGVVVACYNDNGFIITDGSSINCTGSAINPNILTSYQTVQEEPVAISMNGYGPSATCNVMPYYQSVAPIGQFSFTKYTCLAGGGYHIYNYGGLTLYASLLVENSEIWGGQNLILGWTGCQSTFNNNLFARSTVSAVRVHPCALSFTNNLFWGSSSVIIYDSSGSNVIAFNNDFDSCSIEVHTTNCVNGYNAYLNCVGQLNPTNSTDIFSTNSLNYQTSFLGTFYQPTNSPLIQKGSTNANLLGLYHFTTQASQTVEGTNIVTIGYHYVATDTNGVPLDSNGDGIPDYIEDANGNGFVDSGEIGWTLTNDLGLQVIITQPVNGTSFP